MCSDRASRHKSHIRFLCFLSSWLIGKHNAEKLDDAIEEFTLSPNKDDRVTYEIGAKHYHASSVVVCGFSEYERRQLSLCRRRREAHFVASYQLIFWLTQSPLGLSRAFWSINDRMRIDIEFLLDSESGLYADAIIEGNLW